MKLRARALAVMAFGAVLGTAACWQVADLGSYDYEAGAPFGPHDDAGDTSHDASVGDAAADAGDTGSTVTTQCSAAQQDCPSGTLCDLQASVCLMSASCGKPAGVPCVTYPQCGCSGTGTCTLDSDQTGFACVSSGSLTRGAPCTENGSCQTGLACFDGECLAFCGVDGGGCGQGEVCAAASKSVGVYVCVPACNPLANACSGDTSNCDLPADINTVPICVAPGPVVIGKPCNTAVQAQRCLGSLICAPNGKCEIPYPDDAGCDGGGAVTPITQTFGYCP